MQAQIDIKYDQLLNLVKQLPKNQWTKLKSAVEEEEKTSSTSQADMLAFLLNGPTFNKEQLEEIATARKEINQWRKK